MSGQGQQSSEGRVHPAEPPAEMKAAGTRRKAAGSPPPCVHTRVQAVCTHVNPGCVHASCRGPRREEAEAKEKAPRMGGRGCRGHEEQQRDDEAGQKMYVELAARQVLLQGARF